MIDLSPTITRRGLLSRVLAVAAAALLPWRPRGIIERHPLQQLTYVHENEDKTEETRVAYVYRYYARVRDREFTCPCVLTEGDIAANPTLEGFATLLSRLDENGRESVQDLAMFTLFQSQYEAGIAPSTLIEFPPADKQERAEWAVATAQTLLKEKGLL